MSLPPISPTGAMSSGDYTAYMMGYNDSAADMIADDLLDYTPTDTINDWNVMWNRIVTDVNNDVTELEKAMVTLKSQVTMVKNAIKNM